MARCSGASEKRVGKIQFDRVLWGFRKNGKFKAQIAIFDSFSWGGLSSPSGWGFLEWEFRVEVQVVASGSYQHVPASG